jgi:hypothetical protein
LLIITDVSSADAEIFNKQQKYFKEVLEKQGITVYTATAGAVGGLVNNPNGDIGLTPAQLSIVTGIVTIGHGSGNLLADYITPAAMNSLLDRAVAGVRRVGLQFLRLPRATPEDVPLPCREGRAGGVVRLFDVPESELVPALIRKGGVGVGSIRPIHRGRNGWR